MRKAFLVTFEATTKVIADVPENFNPKDSYSKAFEQIVGDARNNILDEPHNYLHEENATVEEDTECPYNEED